MTIFARWTTDRSTAPAGSRIIEEVAGARASVWDDLKELVLGHLLDLDLYRRLGLAEMTTVLQAKLPRSIRARSGDLGEILGSEYVDAETDYAMYIKRLRWKDGRELALRGDDLIGVANSGDGDLRVLKGETKSRASLSKSVVVEAIEKLDENHGEPDPHTLMFLYDRLTEAERHEDAAGVMSVLTSSGSPDRLFHLVFTLSGNNPTTSFSGHEAGTIDRVLVGLVVTDHREFIETLFDDCSDVT